MTAKLNGSVRGYPRLRDTLLPSLIVVAFFSWHSVPAAPPYAVTQPAGPVRSTRAVLNGMAVPRGEPAIAWFEWGTDSTYGQSTPAAEIGSGTATIRVSIPIEDLALGGVYHYRLVTSNASGVVFGYQHMLTTGRKIASWTDPGYTSYSAPINGLTNMVAVACGHGHSLGVRNDGTAVGWGVMGGQYWDVGQADAPAGLSNVVAVAGGFSHSLALKEDGTVVAWGRAAYYFEPFFVPKDLSNVIAIAAGDWHSIALKNDGTVVCWGYQNADRALVVPEGLSNVVAIAAGSAHNIALRADGTVVGWGRSGATDAAPPFGLANVVMISAETWHNLALRADGTVMGWGATDFGARTPPAGLTGVLSVATGFGHSLALTNGGRLIGWGRSTYKNAVPPDLNDVCAIASGDYHSVALTTVNLGPLSFSRGWTNLMNVDSVLTLPAMDPNGDPLIYMIRSLPTNGVIYQYTGSGRGDQITTPDTPLTDPSGRVVFVPRPASFGVPYDRFTFKVGDGEFESAEASATVTVIPAPELQPLGFSGSGTNLNFSFSVIGVPNILYRVLATSNFRGYLQIATTQSASGIFTIVDTDAAKYPLRFYHVRAP